MFCEKQLNEYTEKKKLVEKDLQETLNLLDHLFEKEKLYEKLKLDILKTEESLANLENKKKNLVLLQEEKERFKIELNKLSGINLDELKKEIFNKKRDSKSLKKKKGGKNKYLS